MQCVGAIRIKQSYIGQAVGDKLDLMVLIDGAKEQAAVRWKRLRD
jgi:hypothetical protein